MNENEPKIWHPTISELVNMPKEIVEAVIKTSKAIGQIGKSEENKFARYNYVSIDKYYATVAQKALENGLTWFSKEIESVVVNRDEDKPVLKFTYVFTLVHSSGHCITGIDNLSIWHPFQGPQTAGSAASYADKLFMRRMFKVQTGEDDADAVAPMNSFSDFDGGETDRDDFNDSRSNSDAGRRDLADLDFDDPDPVDIDTDKKSGKKATGKKKPAAPDARRTKTEAAKVETKKAPKAPEDDPTTLAKDDFADFMVDSVEIDDLGLKIVKPDAIKGQWDMVLETFEVFMPDVQTEEDLSRWWDSNEETLEAVEKADPKIYNQITNLFKKAYETIAIEGK